MPWWTNCIGKHVRNPHFISYAKMRIPVNRNVVYLTERFHCSALLIHQNHMGNGESEARAQPYSYRMESLEVKPVLKFSQPVLMRTRVKNQPVHWTGNFSKNPRNPGAYAESRKCPLVAKERHHPFSMLLGPGTHGRVREVGTKVPVVNYSVIHWFHQYGPKT